MYEQVWLALVGDVLQREWEFRNREDPHMVAVTKAGLLLATFYAQSPEISCLRFCERALICKIHEIYVPQYFVSICISYMFSAFTTETQSCNSLDNRPLVHKLKYV